MIPVDGIARLQAWVNAENESMSAEEREQIRYELDLADEAFTIVETRAPWRADFGPEWTRVSVARFMYSYDRQEWSLYWADSYGEFHEYDLIPSSRDVGDLLAEVEEDPTAIFRG